MKSKTKIKVYYDGLCKVCSKEMNHYKKQKGAQNIEFIDIFSPDFNSSDEGLDPVQIHKVMHVRRYDGTIAKRVDAFIEIWSVLPKYQWLVKIAGQKFVKMFLEFGYSVFIILRPYLPRYASPACQDSPYCEIKSRPTPKP